MIIHRVRQYYRECVSHQSSAAERRNVCDYAQGETVVSRVSHKARNLQFARAIYVIIHRVSQRCHVLAIKSIVIKRLNSYDYPHGERALSCVTH